MHCCVQFLIGVSCGLIGTYIVAKRMVFISGGITHASFGGLGLAYFLGLSPLFGAAVFALAAAFCILYLSDNKRFKEDSLIGIFWSAGMAIGVLFIYLTPGYAPNLLSYLFGNILTVTGEQVILSLLLCLVIIVFFAKFYRPLFYIAFDKEYSRTHFVALNGLEIGITALIALCIVLCMKLAGNHSRDFVPHHATLLPGCFIRISRNSLCGQRLLVVLVRLSAYLLRQR